MAAGKFGNPVSGLTKPRPAGRNGDTGGRSLRSPWKFEDNYRGNYLQQQQPTVSPKGRILEIIASWSGVTAPACDTAAENIDKAPAPLGGTQAVLFITDNFSHLPQIHFRDINQFYLGSGSVFLLFILFQKCGGNNGHWSLRLSYLQLSCAPTLLCICRQAAGLAAGVIGVIRTDYSDEVVFAAQSLLKYWSYSGVIVESVEWLYCTVMNQGQYHTTHHQTGQEQCLYT